MNEHFPRTKLIEGTKSLNSLKYYKSLKDLHNWKHNLMFLTVCDCNDGFFLNRLRGTRNQLIDSPPKTKHFVGKHVILWKPWCKVVYSCKNTQINFMNPNGSNSCNNEQLRATILFCWKHEQIHVSSQNNAEIYYKQTANNILQPWNNVMIYVIIRTCEKNVCNKSKQWTKRI